MSALRSRGALLRQHHPKTRRPLDVHPGAILFGFAPLANSSADRLTIRAGAQEPSRHRRDRLTESDPRVGCARRQGPASYVVQQREGMTVAGSQTTATFSNGFDYSRVYSFSVFAVSSSGGWSGASNAVTATLLSDTTPAATPVVSSTGNGLDSCRPRVVLFRRGPEPAFRHLRERPAW